MSLLTFRSKQSPYQAHQTSAAPIDNDYPNPSSSTDNSTNATTDIATLNLFQATTNCSALLNPYTSTFTDGIEFNIDCQTDHFGDDMFYIFAYLFEDCIEACAHWPASIDTNDSCVGVTYSINQTRWPAWKGWNCWLKKEGGPASSNPSVSSAMKKTS